MTQEIERLTAIDRERFAERASWSGLCHRERARAEAAEAQAERLRKALEEAEAGLSAMIRLSDMGLEESLKEPEENGNFASYNRAVAARDKIRAVLTTPLSEDGSAAQIETCPECDRDVFVGNPPGRGYLAECGRRVARVEQCRAESCRAALSDGSAVEDDLVRRLRQWPASGDKGDPLAVHVVALLMEEAAEALLAKDAAIAALSAGSAVALTSLRKATPLDEGGER